MLRNRSAWFLDRLRWSVEFHLNLRRYHFVFITLTYPPVVLDPPENRYMPDCVILSLSVVRVVVEGVIYMIVEFSTMHNLTSHRES